MNELEPHPNESYPDGRMTKKSLKKIKKLLHMPTWYMVHLLVQ